MFTNEFESYKEIEKDCIKYREIALRYLKLEVDNPREAWELSKDAWALAERWNTIQTFANQVAKLYGGSKTEFAKWAYHRYRQLHLLHEHARITWKMGEDEARRYNGN